MSKSSFLGLLFLLLLAVGGYFIYQDMKQTAQDNLQPFQQANAALQTQVADLMNPTPTIIPDPATYILQIQSLARLETIQYSVEKVITAEVGQGNFNFLFGDSLLFVAHGTVIAGIDLGKMTPQDFLLQDDILYVRLPQPEIFVATLDNEKSYVYRRDTGILTRQTVDLETLARQSAEEEIKKAAIEDGILTTAQQNAEVFMIKFFNNLGYKNVQIVK